MSHSPSLLVEVARTAAGLILTQRSESAEQQLHGTAPAALGASSTRAAAISSMLLDDPQAFIAQIRSFIPPSLFAKRIHAADLQIFYASCSANGVKPSTIIASWIAHCHLSTLSIQDLQARQAESLRYFERKAGEEKQRKRDEERRRTALEREKAHRAAEEEKQKKLKEAAAVAAVASDGASADAVPVADGQQEQAEGDRTEAAQQEDGANDSAGASNLVEEEREAELTAAEHLAQLTAASAAHFIRGADAPLDAARALVGSFYATLTQLSTAVWSAMARARKERDLQAATDARSAAARGAFAGGRPSSGSGSGSGSKPHKLPPLVGVRGLDDDEQSLGPSQRLGRRFVLNHDMQKLGGVPKHPLHAIRPLQRQESAHDHLAAMRGDELRSHVELVSPTDLDSSAPWDLASQLDFPASEFPTLASSSSSSSSALASMRSPRRMEAELRKLCEQVAGWIRSLFLTSEGFCAPIICQCLIVLRSLNAFDAAARQRQQVEKMRGTGAGSRLCARFAVDPESDATRAAQRVAGTAKSSPVMAAMLGVEPRVPQPYIVSIEGRQVHVPNPLPSHSVLVASALRAQADANIARTKHNMRALSNKTDRILELQRASMRPMAKLRPPPHVAGRSRRQELGFYDDVDTAGALETVLKSRYNSLTVSVLRRKEQ